MEVGLFFGSFNPIHIGHMAIANYISEFTSIDELWFVVSPHNPLKDKESLLPDYQRLELVNRAIGDYPKFRASNIEFNLPQPSFTIDTLAYLTEKFPNYDFVLIMGEDNLQSFQKWKNHELILNRYRLMVYKRPGSHIGIYHHHHKVTLVDAPQMDVSSSFIRQSIKAEKDVRFFMPEAVWKYVDEMNFYKK